MKFNQIYRGKSIESGVWVEGYLSIQDKEGDGKCGNRYGTYIAQYHESDFGDFMIYVEVSDIDICIGLRDKNNTKIFENDIVVVDGEDGYFTIKYDATTARFVMEGNDLILDFDSFYSKEIEVVGNETEVKYVPTTDVAPVIHAHWIKDERKIREDGETYDYCCSLCKGIAIEGQYGNYDVFTDYCPHCGAKMDEKESKI